MNVFNRRIRGFRLVDLVGMSLLVSIILGVYLAKTLAGRERAEIASIERQIRQEHARIRLLRAEVAHLEQPGRLSALSTQYLGLEPASLKREVSTEELSAAMATPVPVVELPPAPAAPVIPPAEAQAPGDDAQ